MGLRVTCAGRQALLFHPTCYVPNPWSGIMQMFATSGLPPCCLRNGTTNRVAP